MATTNKPARLPSIKEWPCVVRPPGATTYSLMRSVVKRTGADIVCDTLHDNAYWGIVRTPPQAAATIRMYLTRRGRERGLLHYLFFPEEHVGFPQFPPQAFYVQLLAYCPNAPSDAAALWRARCVKRHAELDAASEYPVGTEFILLGVHLRITGCLGKKGYTAISIPDDDPYILKPEHLLSAKFLTANGQSSNKTKPNH